MQLLRALETYIPLAEIFMKKKTRPSLIPLWKMSWGAIRSWA